MLGRGDRGARIRAKLNGLADPEIIAALYRASQAGVDVELVVRGVCTLRPGVVGLSERIHVVSVLGRFLEHARIYHFANAATPSTTSIRRLRPRNLRHRVEVVTPVRDGVARGRLDAILRAELEDPTAWDLDPMAAITAARRHRATIREAHRSACSVWSVPRPDPAVALGSPASCSLRHSGRRRAGSRITVGPRRRTPHSPASRRSQCRCPRFSRAGRLPTSGLGTAVLPRGPRARGIRRDRLGAPGRQG